MVKKRKEKRAINYYLFEILFVIVNIIIVILFYKNILWTTIFLFVLAIIGLVKWKSLRTFMIFLIGAVGGGIIEIICIYFGVWKYTVTNFFNIPFWLFILWGNATAIIYQIAKKIKEKKMRVK